MPKGQLYNDGNSSIGKTQLNAYKYDRKALVEAREQQFFGQLADTITMPKNSGKRIRKYHYLPLLDDRNINDQGIDATGQEITNGNLYGSSKDIGTISGKMPVVGETGGRVNRVGFTRVDIEGTFEKFGVFTEWSEEYLAFDSDAELMTHINRELLTGAMQMTEDALQVDLITNATTNFFSGTALAPTEISETSVVTYQDLMKLSITLDNNHTPKQTKMITGTRLTDTRTIPAGRVMYCGSEMIPTLEAMVDLHGRPAWRPVNEYAAGTTLLKGERGTIGEFKIIIVPKMLKWEGKGAAGNDASFYATNGKYDVFPMLVVGSESFTTIGFQTNGKTNKFITRGKKPGNETATRDDPYGEMGFSSLKWWYGFMPLRPERIAVLHSAAKM